MSHLSLDEHANIAKLGSAYEGWKLSQYITFILTLCMLWFLSKLYIERMKVRHLKAQGIPIMTHSFLLGHLPIVYRFHREWAMDANFTQTFSYYISKNWQKFYPGQDHRPPVIYVDVWPIFAPVAFTIEAKVSDQMVLDKSNIPKSRLEGDFLKPLTDAKDLVSISGEEWKMWRRRFNPGFSASNITTMIPAVLEEVEAFVEVLQKLTGENGNWGPVFPLEQTSYGLSLDVTGRAVLNTRLNSLSANPNRFSVCFRKQVSRMEITVNPLKVLSKATPMFQAFIAYKRAEMLGILRPFILENIKNPSTSTPHTIVQASVKEYNHETSTKERDPDESFVQAVFHQLMIFFFAGDDAAATTTPWVIFHLQRNPECQAKLRAEHDAIFGNDPKSAADKIRGDPHLLNALPYTLAVIKETLRLSPATTTMREGQPDFAFRVTEPNTDWPEFWPTEGFQLIDSPKTIHRDPKLFPRPEEFIPERYLVQDSDPLHPAPNTWRAFQFGARRCIGSELAIMQVKLVLALVVRKFDIELAWEEWDEMREKQGIKVTREKVLGERLYTTGKATAHPKDGAPVHIRLRKE